MSTLYGREGGGRGGGTLGACRTHTPSAPPRPRPRPRPRRAWSRAAVALAFLLPGRAAPRRLGNCHGARRGDARRRQWGAEEGGGAVAVRVDKEEDKDEEGGDEQGGRGAWRQRRRRVRGAHSSCASARRPSIFSSTPRLNLHTKTSATAGCASAGAAAAPHRAGHCAQVTEQKGGRGRGAPTGLRDSPARPPAPCRAARAPPQAPRAPRAPWTAPSSLCAGSFPSPPSSSSSCPSAPRRRPPPRRPRARPRPALPVGTREGGSVQ